MDLLCILGTKPSSAILCQHSNLKSWKVMTPKVPKQAEAKGDGEINPENNNLNPF